MTDKPKWTQQRLLEHTRKRHDDYDWWAKMTFDDIKRVRDIIEAAVRVIRLMPKRLVNMGNPKLSKPFQLAMKALAEAVEAYEKEKG